MVRWVDRFVVDWDVLEPGGHVFVPCINGPATRKRLQEEATRQGYRVSLKYVIHQGRYGIMVIREV